MPDAPFCLRSNALRPAPLSANVSRFGMRKHLATIIVIAIAGLCGLVLLSNYLSSGRMVTTAADAAMCKNNLIAIGKAKAQWVYDEHKTTNDVPSWSDLVGTNRFFVSVPECRAGGVYTIGRVGEPARCSLPGHGL